MEERNMRLLYDEEQIRARVKQLAAEICADYTDDKPILCVCILRGAVMFFTDLVKEMQGKNVMFDFVTLSSYENAMYTRDRKSVV